MNCWAFPCVPLFHYLRAVTASQAGGHLVEHSGSIKWRRKRVSISILCRVFSGLLRIFQRSVSLILPHLEHASILSVTDFKYMGERKDIS